MDFTENDVLTSYNFYFFDLKKLPEDGTSVLKHVENYYLS